MVELVPQFLLPVHCRLGHVKRSWPVFPRKGHSRQQVGNYTRHALGCVGVSCNQSTRTPRRARTACSLLTRHGQSRLAALPPSSVHCPVAQLLTNNGSITSLCSPPLVLAFLPVLFLCFPPPGMFFLLFTWETLSFRISSAALSSLKPSTDLLLSFYVRKPSQGSSQITHQ